MIPYDTKTIGLGVLAVIFIIFGYAIDYAKVTEIFRIFGFILSGILIFKVINK